MINKMSIDDEIFEGLRSEYDAILNDTLVKMCNQGTSDGTITMKLAIAFETVWGVDENAKRIKMMVPTFRHEVSNLVQTKEKLNGEIEGCGVITYDEKQGDWVLNGYDDGQMEFD